VVVSANSYKPQILPSLSLISLPLESTTSLFLRPPSDYGAKIEDLKPQPHWGLARFDPAAYVDLYHSQLCWELSRPWLETMV
jgi:hypothetical protein